MKALKGGVLAAVALLTCPCHLPLLLAVLAGTAAGAWLARYQGPTFGLMATVFAVAVYLLFRRLNEGSAYS